MPGMYAADKREHLEEEIRAGLNKRLLSATTTESSRDFGPQIAPQIDTLVPWCVIWYQSGEADLDEVYEVSEMCNLTDAAYSQLCAFLYNDMGLAQTGADAMPDEEMVQQVTQPGQETVSHQGQHKRDAGESWNTRSAKMQYLTDMAPFQQMTKQEADAAAKTYIAGKKAQQKLDENQNALSPDEQRELKRAIRKGNAAKDELIQRHWRLPVWVACRQDTSTIDLMDLIQEGNIALVAAVDGYDPDLGAFSTYTIPKIKKRILSYIREQDGLTKKTRRFAELVAILNQTRERLVKEYGREPSIKELAREAELPEKKVHFVLRQLEIERARPLDAPVFSSGSQNGDPSFDKSNQASVGDMIADESSQKAFEKIIAPSPTRTRQTLDYVMRKYLTPTEEIVVRLRKGLENNVVYTCLEIAQELGYTKENVIMIESRAYEKLQSLDTIRLYDEIFT